MVKTATEDRMGSNTVKSDTSILYKLYNNEKIEVSNDALTVLLHTFMLETGFIPVTQSESSPDSMPLKWKSSGIYKIQYVHICSHETFCWMTCIPMGPVMVVCGTIEKVQLPESINITLKVDDYVDQSALKSVSDAYRKVDELSIAFKDSFCYSILASIQYHIGLYPTFGLSGLLEDLKYHILTFLPVESITAVFKLNKEFHELTNSAMLWKQLYFRDFSKTSKDDPDISLSSKEEKIDFKDLYRKEYLKQRSLKKRFQNPLRFMPSYNPIPHPFLSFDHQRDIDMRIDLDPDVQLAFPHLRDRFRPRNPFLQQLFPNRRPPFQRWC